MNIFKRAWIYYRTNGVIGSIRRVIKGKETIKILESHNYIVDNKVINLSKEDYLANKTEKLTLNWIIPEMGKGSGGHLNIFRFISYLERNNIHNRVYLFNPPNIKDDEKLKEFVEEHFPILDKNVELYSNIEDIKYAHGTVATSWQTAYFVRKFDNTISKFYFIQDFEPYFYAKGSEYHFAENTYKFGFRGITAGDWLKDVCSKEYGMKCDSFKFSYDKELYFPKEKKDKQKRVFFYARPVTPRRDFELGLLALNLLSEKIENLEVLFAGWNIDQYEIPFKYKNAGILKIEELSDCYAQCDLCLVISSTNLSLLPIEIMASNSVAVCSKGANSEWLLNEENAVLVDHDPIQIASVMEKYLNNEKSLEKMRKKGIEYAKSTSWDKEGEKVLNAIIKGVSEDEKSISNRW